MRSTRPIPTTPTRGVPDSVGDSLWRSAAWTGAGAVVIAAACAVLVSVVCWLPEAGVSGHPTSALRAGLLAFLTAQHGGITLDGTHAGLVPLGMTVFVVLVAWRAGTVLAETAQRLDCREPRALLRAGILQSACYTLAAMVLVPFAALGSTTVPLFSSGVGALLTFAPVSLVALARGSALGPVVGRRLSPATWRGLRVVGAVAAVYAASGALLVAGSLMWHAGTVTHLSGLVGGGVSGLPILLLGALCAPNAMIAATAYLIGPGFAVGSGTHVGLFATTHGTVPAFPILGALPVGRGASPFILAWAAATLLVAGIVALRQLSGVAAREALRSAVRAAGSAALGAALLAWLGGGSVGPGRLSAVGASPWQLGLIAGLAVVLLTAPVIALGVAWQWSRRTQVPKFGRGSRDAEVEPESDRPKVSLIRGGADADETPAPTVETAEPAAPERAAG
jgi:hypothetical protein